ncbi:MAG: hypothetical protein ACTSWA_11915 [Candidatus Thorarchaeota archaeon]
MGRERLILVGLVCLSVVCIGGMALFYFAPSAPAEKPWLDPPVGMNDFQYENDTTLYGGNSIYTRLQNSIAFVKFQTYNRPVLLYGSFNSPDGNIDFFLIDEEGFASLMANGGIPSDHIFDNFNDDFEVWEYMLQPSLNDDPVEAWYVVYSAYMIGILDARSISAITCQDRTAPSIDFSLSNEVNESIEIQFAVSEPRGDIALVQLYIDDVIVYQWQPFNQSISPLYNWNTEQYSNGEHWVGIYVQDRVGNNRAVWLNTTVANYYPLYELPIEFNYSLYFLTILFSILVSLFVICIKGSRIELSIISIILMLLGAFGFATTEYQPGPFMDLGLTIVSGLGICLSLYSIYSGRKRIQGFELRFSDIMDGLKGTTYKIEEEGTMGRDHTTRKSREIRKKIEDSEE